MTAANAGSVRQSGDVLNLSPHLLATVEQCFATIEADPRILLEEFGGPVGMEAHVIVARLFGWDEQIDAEMRLRRVESTLLVPIWEPLARMVAEVDPTIPAMRTAEYRLQSVFAKASLVAEHAPKESHGDDFLVTVLCVRYRR